MKKITLLLAILSLTVSHSYAIDPKIDADIYNDCLLCEPPQNLTVSNISSNSVDLAWTAPTSGDEIQNYQYSIVPTQNPVDGPATLTPFASSQVLLQPSTTYYAYVRSFCSNTWSAWSAAVAFTTLCAPSLIPYTQDFESAIIPAVPNCTAVQNSGSGNNWAVVQNPGDGFTSKTLQYSASPQVANAWFFTQGVQFEAGVAYRLSYKYGNDTINRTERLTVTIANSPSAAGVIGEDPFFGQYEISNGTMETMVQGPFYLPEGVSYVAFKVFSWENQSSLRLDDIVVEEFTCGSPIQTAISNITSNAATVSWAAPSGNEAQVYSYAVTTSAVPPENASQFTPFLSNSLTNLSAATTYYIHARALCSGVPSEWSTVSFTTQPLLKSSDFIFDKLIVYPNPVTDVLSVSNGQQIDRIELYNVLGQRILSQDSSALNIEVDLERYQKGCYLISVYSGTSMKTVGLIKK
ncbi:MAG TPA: fibronectin type III domain-containing protein [Flavobacterium sp.]|jgi:hypothetical protein